MTTEDINDDYKESCKLGVKSNKKDMKENKSEDLNRNDKRISNKTKLIFGTILLIVLIIILILLIKYLIERNTKYDYIVIYLNDEYDVSNLEEIKEMNKIIDAYYISAEEAYNSLDEKVVGIDFDLIYDTDDFSNMIIAKVKRSSDTSYLNEIKNKTYVEQALYTDSIYETILLDTLEYIVYMKVADTTDTYDDSYDTVYQSICNIESSYDVKKVTKEDVLEDLKEELGEEDAEILSGYDDNNSFADTVTFKVSDVEQLTVLSDLLEAIVESDSNVDYYANVDMAKVIMDALSD